MLPPHLIWASRIVKGIAAVNFSATAYKKLRPRLGENFIVRKSVQKTEENVTTYQGKRQLLNYPWQMVGRTFGIGAAAASAGKGKSLQRTRQRWHRRTPPMKLQSNSAVQQRSGIVPRKDNNNEGKETHTTSPENAALQIIRQVIPNAYTSDMPNKAYSCKKKKHEAWHMSQQKKAPPVIVTW